MIGPYARRASQTFGLVVSAVFAFASIAYASAEDTQPDSVEYCTTNQATMNECAERRIEQTEQAMQVEIERVRNLLVDSERLEFFDKEVDAWHAYRDAHCLANNLYASGSYGVTYGDRCRDILTRDRTKKLQEFAAQLLNEDKRPYAAIAY